MFLDDQQPDDLVFMLLCSQLLAVKPKFYSWENSSNSSRSVAYGQNVKIASGHLQQVENGCWTIGWQCKCVRISWWIKKNDDTTYHIVGILTQWAQGNHNHHREKIKQMQTGREAMRWQGRKA